MNGLVLADGSVKPSLEVFMRCHGYLRMIYVWAERYGIFQKGKLHIQVWSAFQVPCDPFQSRIFPLAGLFKGSMFASGTLFPSFSSSDPLKFAPAREV